MKSEIANPDYIQELEALVVNNRDLEELEALLDQFNIFEALGAVRVELRHSDFLSFLLNPHQSHGLGDTLVKRLLQKVVASFTSQSLQITALELDLLDLDEILVLREWQNIDILLVDDRNKLAVIIENKIDSTEHGDQLTRYLQIVKQHHPNHKIISIFLTPDGDPPSDEEYLPISYLVVCELVEELAKSRASTLGLDIHLLLVHYAMMLRRHIVSESKIAELCRSIYRKHQRALDLIYEYKPDHQQAIHDILIDLIGKEENLISDHSSKAYIMFSVKAWDVPILLQGEGWTQSRRMLLFEFDNFADRLALKLIIGPGSVETRQKLLDFAHNQKPLFRPAQHALGKMYNTIFVSTFLSASAYENNDGAELEIEIQKKWKQFLEHDLPNIQAALKSETWIWKKE